MCYRTTIDQCENSSLNISGYRLYLNRRNLNNLLQNCPHESETLTVIDRGGVSVSFHSPRYECRKKNGRMYPYRNKELCLYNISVPNCESGSVVIVGYQYALQQLQERSHNGQCVDYLTVPLSWCLRLSSSHKSHLWSRICNKFTNSSHKLHGCFLVRWLKELCRVQTEGSLPSCRSI